MKTIKLILNTKNQKYPVVIGSGITKNLSRTFNKYSIKYNRCLLVIDKNIPKILIKETIKSLSKKKNYCSFL